MGRGQKINSCLTGLLDGGDGYDRNPAREAKKQREYLKEYFNNEGAVPAGRTSMTAMS